jgi:hypothetical protein
MSEVIPAIAKNQPKSAESSMFDSETQVAKTVSFWASRGFYILVWLLLCGFSLLFWAGVTMIVF